MDPACHIFIYDFFGLRAHAIPTKVGDPIMFCLGLRSGNFHLSSRFGSATYLCSLV